MQKRKNLREGMLINWEAIATSSDEPFFRERKSYSNEEMRQKSRDLGIEDIGWDIENIHSLRLKALKKSDKKSLYEHDLNHSYIVNMITSPFTSKWAITQVHDSIEELVCNPDLTRAVVKAISICEYKFFRLEELFQTGKITDLQLQRGVLEEYYRLGNVLGRTDSTLLRDIGDIFHSRELEDSPVGQYSALLSSDEIKVRIDNLGFEIYPDNPDIRVDHQQEKFFTRDEGNDSLINECIKRSIQSRRAHELLSETKNFLAYLASITSYTLELGLKKPSFNPDNSLNIQGGYHPAFKSPERTRKIFTRHNTTLEDHEKVLAITGPNAGGKSTYLKELALTSMLAQAGFFVPADSANLPVYTKFLTHFGKKDNLSEDLSLFHAEIQSLSENLNNLEDKSLFVCDELFKGTESGRNGGHLLHKTVVETVLEDYPGRVLLSSHYHDSLAEQTELQNIKFLRAEVNYDKKPTYKFSEGVDSGGYAIRSAVRLGLPDKITRRLGLSDKEVLRLRRNGNGKLHKKESRKDLEDYEDY